MAHQVQSRSASGGGSPFRLYKPGQGKYVRGATAAGAGLLAISCAYFIWQQIQRFEFTEQSYLIRALVPVIALVGLGYLIFWMVGRKENVVDFLIATEGEMKKVNWSSRREVWGATRVVIVTVLMLAIMLFVVDVLFMLFFGSIGVLREVRVYEIFFPGEA